MFNGYISLFAYCQDITVQICSEVTLEKWPVSQSFAFSVLMVRSEQFFKKDVDHLNIHLEFKKFILIKKPKEAQIHVPCFSK